MGSWAVRVMSFDAGAGALEYQPALAEVRLATVLSLFEMMSQGLP